MFSALEKNISANRRRRWNNCEFRNPILIGGGKISGRQRVRKAKKLGLRQAPAWGEGRVLPTLPDFVVRPASARVDALFRPRVRRRRRPRRCRRCRDPPQVTGRTRPIVVIITAPENAWPSHDAACDHFKMNTFQCVR